MDEMSQLLKHKLIFISGKGGVGKTSICASLALKASKMGKKVLLAENSFIEQIPPLFSIESPVGHYEKKISENLYYINLDPKECLKEYVVDYLEMPRLYHNIFRHNLIDSFLNVIPGLNDMMILGRLCHSAKQIHKKHKFDLVIFDAPATGHFYYLLKTPGAVFSSGLKGPLVNEIHKIDTFLRSDACASYLVTLPESLVTSETIEFLPKIIETSPVKLKGIFLNRTFYQDEFLSLQEIASHSSSLNQDKNAFSYLKSKVENAVCEQKKFINELNRLNTDVQCMFLPELGRLFEPISQDLLQDIRG